MKKLSLSILIIVSFFFSNDSFSADENPGRFRKPLDEETGEKKFKSESFSDFVPQKSSSVFANLNVSNNPAPQNETSVKISRKDPDRVVAAWRDFRISVTPANRRVGYSYSTDGGFTWAESKLLDSTLIPGFPKNSDPVVTTDSAGNFYIAVICISNTGALAIYKSTDGGVTFPNAYMIANDGSEDKEYMETDFTPGSPYLNSIYISWTRFSGVRGIKLTKSTNAGVNWTTAVPVSDVNLGNQGSDVAVGLDGEVYVTWLDANTSNDIVMFDKSTNGGNTFSTDKNIAEGPPPDIPISSSGITFPSIAADITNGSNSGNIYVTFCDSRNGDPDVFLVRSTNRGVNWSSPVRVNNDPVGNGKLQCWPWIAVDETGNIAITFFDSRNTSSNTVIENYVAYSSDGGLTFLNLQVSNVPTPTAQPNFDVRFGDYIGVDYYNDLIIPVWTDERAGGFDMECYSGIVSTPVSINNLLSEIPENFKLFQNYPNPFNPNTVIRYSIGSQEGGSGFVSLKVYNSLGTEVKTLVDRKQNTGNYEVNFSGNDLSSGIYFYKLQTDGFVQTKSMILLK